MIRPPAVAGRFYPAKSEALARDLKKYIAPAARRLRALGCLVPHAGYMYSGPVAGAVYGALELPSTVVILGPNHYGRGAALALSPESEWETPLGLAPVDRDLAARIQAAFPRLREDALAHGAEHSLEVQIPFLQSLIPGFSFVPVSIGAGSFEPLEAFGEALAAVLAHTTKPVFLVASSDMNHYEDDQTTRLKDRQAIDAMLALDPRRLYDVVRDSRISMCGYGPAVAALTAACRLGADRAELICYSTSGDTTGQRDRVVGYAGLAFYRQADQVYT